MNSESGKSYRYYIKTYDDVSIRVRKPGRDIIKAAAAAQGESMRQYIIAAINTRLALDGKTIR